MTTEAAPSPAPSTPPSETAQQPTPPAAQPAATPSPRPEAAPAPTSLQEARQRLFTTPDWLNVADQRAKVTGEKPHHSALQPRDEQSRFAGPPQPATEGVPAEAASPTPQAAPATAPEAGTAAPGSTAAQETGRAPAAPAAGEEPEVPEGRVRIEIPEGHVLRSRGRTEIVVDQADEDYHRWAINNAVRREQVAEAGAAVQAWEDHAMQLQTQVQAMQSFAYRLMADPSVALYVADNRRAYGDAGAERAIRGLWAEVMGETGDIGKVVAQSRQQREAERQKSQLSAQADTFLESALQLAAKRYPLATREEIAESIRAYGHAVDARGSKTLDVREWATTFGDPFYMRNPKAQEAYRQKQQQDIEAAKRAERERLAAEEAAKLRAANERRAMNPYRALNMGGGSAGREVPADAGRPVSVHEARSALYRGTAAGSPPRR